MEIRFTESGHRGTFTAHDGDVIAGKLVTSRMNASHLIIEHTEVAPSHAGTGLGKALVAAAVDWARANHQRFLPLCPFARAIFDRTPAYNDVRQGG
ncbi:MAG: N-acetyltransferase [Gemmatimonadetes bacterium]|nr:N-acetyltransferase [Gemmatimonadota bacterium]